MPQRIEITDQYIDVPGGNIFVKRWRPKDHSGLPPVILLHDSLGCVAMWKDFPEKICEESGREVIAYDRLGFGLSSARTNPANFNFIDEEAEIFLPVILNSLGLSKYILFGHSVGGAMAIVSASRFGEGCEGVITESSQAFVEERTLQGIQKAKLDFANPNTFVKLEKYHGQKTRWVLDAWINVWLSPSFSQWSLKKDLPQVICPVLAIHGDKDEYGSNRFPEMICELVGGVSEMKIISDCGHVPHREKQSLILEIVNHFLKKN